VAFTDYIQRSGNSKFLWRKKKQHTFCVPEILDIQPYLDSHGVALKVLELVL
jgi:hypothetical protein